MRTTGPIAFRLDGILAISTALHRVEFHSGKDGELLRGFDSQTFPFFMKFSDDGKFFAVCGRETIEFRKGNTGELLSTQKTSARHYSLGFSPDGKTLAAGCLDALELWDLDSGKLRTIKKVSCPLLAYSPDGKRLATASGGLKSKLSIWEVQTGKEICSKKFDEPSKGIAFPTNDCVVHAGARTVRIFELSVHDGDSGDKRQRKEGAP